MYFANSTPEWSLFNKVHSNVFLFLYSTLYFNQKLYSDVQFAKHTQMYIHKKNTLANHSAHLKFSSDLIVLFFKVTVNFYTAIWLFVITYQALSSNLDEFVFSTFPPDATYLVISYK